MKNKRKYFVCLGIAAVCVIGGLILFNSLKSKEEKYRAEQDKLALYLDNNYKNIDTVQFTYFEKNSTTGYWDIEAIVNSDIFISFSTINFEQADINITEHISQSKGKELIKKETPTNNQTTDITVQYLELK
ncbi:DUF1433 domain-containing protein [Streptococcus sp. H49]|uniref:DUF1433 domain-containing protein n=1 Tax=Streptococcus huangxiaojuni TaxID=3237239 RepID=UPI0034A17842